MKSAKELWQYISRHGLKPLPKTSVSEWADTYRYLSAGVSSEPGKWRTERAEYQRAIMDAFTEPGVHRVVVKSAAQIGKSDIMNKVIGRFAHLDPASIMMIQPTVDMAQDYSKSRIAPMIRDTPVLSSLFYDVKRAGDKTAKTRDGNNTILSKFFPGGRLVMCGANSPAGLASRPIRILLADEVDRFPDSAGTEGDPVDLAAKRMTTFWNRVMGLFSTPTTEGSSRIDAEYIAGTQEEWQHQCPNCGEWHLLRYLDMETDAETYKDDRGGRLAIVRRGKWR
ncbi:phage terminase large subunit family protein [Megasphaera sp.]|uniref:phage terminase large subunit family protein n=1 Tax=Megasphaera sp. TaxID=2023260 RepID=UPI003FEFF27C